MSAELEMLQRKHALLQQLEASRRQLEEARHKRAAEGAEIEELRKRALSVLQKRSRYIGDGGSVLEECKMLMPSLEKRSAKLRDLEPVPLDAPSNWEQRLDAVRLACEDGRCSELARAAVDVVKKKEETILNAFKSFEDTESL